MKSNIHMPSFFLPLVKLDPYLEKEKYFTFQAFTSK